MPTPLIDLDQLLKLRLVVARFGEMDLAKWWNTKGQLGRLGTAALRRGFLRTHRFAQARSVFVLRSHQEDETSHYFAGPRLGKTSGEAHVDWRRSVDDIDSLVAKKFGLREEDATWLEAPSAVGAAKKTKKRKANA